MTPMFVRHLALSPRLLDLAFSSLPDKLTRDLVRVVLEPVVEILVQDHELKDGLLLLAVVD